MQQYEPKQQEPATPCPVRELAAQEAQGKSTVLTRNATLNMQTFPFLSFPTNFINVPTIYFLPIMVSSSLSRSPLCSHISRKMPPSLFQSSLGAPYSATRPSPSTRILSKSAMVLKRWAMTRRVLSVNSSRMLRWMEASVAMSTADVASSRTMILGRETMARAMQRSWRWPCDRLPPDSEMPLFRSRKMLTLFATMVELADDEGSFAGVAGSDSSKWTLARHSRSSSSVW